MTRRIGAAAREGGFTLVEVLVAVLVLSIGLLGIAALQTASMRGTQAAYFRSQASALSYQIVDAMRANPEAAEDGAYATGFDDGASGINCDTSLAASDLCTWKEAIESRLPAGQGLVSVDGSDLATICLRWAEPEDEVREVGTSTGSCNAPDGVRLLEVETVL